MTTAVISNYLEVKIINHVLRNTAYTTPGASVYIALFTDASVQDDANSGTEVSTSGTAYSRVQCTAWDAPASRATQNTNQISFATATADWGNIRYVGIFDHASAGNLLFWGQLTADKNVGNGDTFSIGAGDLDITLDGAFGNYLSHALLNHILRNTAYPKPATVKAHLYTTMPNSADAGGTEVSGGSYAAITIFDTTDWDDHADGTTENTNVESFPQATAAWGEVKGVCLRDESANLLFFGNLSANKTVGDGDTFRFSAGALDVSVT
jgi:hypothetical protein